MSDVAFLVYDPVMKGTKRKRTGTGFVWRTNTGAFLIIDVLQRAGIEVGFCSPESAHKHKIVLVSMTSTFDVFNLIHAIGRWRTWRDRSFKAIAGGAGMVNPLPLRRFIDYAVFGRGEDLIVDLVKRILAGDLPDHPSIMPLAEEVREVHLAQARELYPHRLDVKPHWWEEREIGCPRKCFFCHYTFARKHMKSHTAQHLGNTPWSSAPEVLLDRLLEDGDLKSKTTTAIDGMSERLRKAFNKPYTNDLIREVIHEASRRWKGRGVYLRVYQIGSFPTETDQDREEFIELIRDLDPPLKRVILDIHVTPYEPSALTPGSYMGVSFSPRWNDLRNRTIVNRPNLVAKWSRFIESPYTTLLRALALRATSEHDEIFDVICLTSQLDRMKSWEEKLVALMRLTNLEDLIREYSTDEDLPTSFLRSYTPDEQVRKMARKLKRNLGIEEKKRCESRTTGTSTSGAEQRGSMSASSAGGSSRRELSIATTKTGERSASTARPSSSP